MIEMNNDFATCSPLCRVNFASGVILQVSGETRLRSSHHKADVATRLCIFELYNKTNLKRIIMLLFRTVLQRLIPE
jgi:hypothetical protein